MSDVFQGRLDEAAAHLAVAETYAETAPPERRRRLRVAVASLQLSLATRRGHLAGVIDQASFLASPMSGQSDEDIALGNDLRAVALYNLGTVEAYLGLPDAGAARVRVEDPPARHYPAALPRGDRARRATWMGRGTVDRARADSAGRHDGVDG